jgi:hypothetical protein
LLEACIVLGEARSSVTAETLSLEHLDPFRDSIVVAGLRGRLALCEEHADSLAPPEYTEQAVRVDGAEEDG